jgi:phenylacetic acid degradation operon negative regulatory protein
MANLRMGELRPDTWMRPANLGGPAGVPSLAIVRGELEGEDPVELAARLWPLDDLARSATSLVARVERVEPTLLDGDGQALPPAITLAAEVVRLLRAEPLLPPSLIPQPWPVDDLRARYRSFDRTIGRALAQSIRVFAEGKPRSKHSDGRKHSDGSQVGAMGRPKRSSNLA